MKSQFSGWYKVWFSPKEVMTYAANNVNKLSVFLLLFLYGLAINYLFNSAGILNSVALFGINAKLIFTQSISAIVAGVVVALIYTFFLYILNAMFKKSIGFKKLFIIYSWSLVPFVLFIPLTIVFKPIGISMLLLFFVLSLYSSALLVFGLSEVNQITFGKAAVIVSIVFVLNNAISFVVSKDMYQQITNQAMLLKLKQHNKSALLIAVEKNNIAEVQKLLEQGMDVNEIDSLFKVTPLLRSQSFEMTKLLVENGADVNVAINNITVLNNKRAYCSSYEITKYFFEHGLKDEVINFQNALKETALHHGDRCSFCENYEYEDGSKNIELLLQHGANPNVKDYEGETPIFTVRDKSKKLLIDYGADIFALNNKGDTVLFRVQDLELFKFLERKGVDIKHKNKLGQTILDVTQNAEIRNYLASK
ncbi:MAG: YIP1 family protein [Sulfurovaceae bacterium]